MSSGSGPRPASLSSVGASSTESCRFAGASTLPSSHHYVMKYLKLFDLKLLPWLQPELASLGFVYHMKGRRIQPGDNASGAFQLTIDPRDLSADIRLIGDGFRSVDTRAGSLTLKLPFGLYQMRIQIGRQVVEKVILLDGDWPKPVKVLAADQLPALPEITSAAPLPFTRASHEYQQDAARQSLTRVDVTAGAGAELMVMARVFSESGNADPAARPWDGVAVLDASGTLIADLATTGQHTSGGDPAGACTVALSPGAYVNRTAASPNPTVP